MPSQLSPACSDLSVPVRSCVKAAVLRLGGRPGPFGHLRDAAAALQQVAYLSFITRRVSAASLSVTPLFSTLAAAVRAGTVYSIKMLLEHQCAFVNYTRGEDCLRAIQQLNVG